MEFDVVIRGGSVVGGRETIAADVGVIGEKIAAVEAGLPTGRTEIRADGHLVVPGGIDVHTHFDRFHDWLGLRNADTYESGTKAAAAGGVTTIVNFAHQSHGQTLEDSVSEEAEKARGTAVVDYGLHVTVTDLSVPGTLEDVGRLADEGFASVKIFVALPKAGLSSRDVLSLLEVTRDQGILVSVHAEDDRLSSHLTEQLLAQQHIGVSYFPKAHPVEAEAIATARVAGYARALQAPVYFVHLSSRAALDEVRIARQHGGEVYVETRPVYLYLDAGLYDRPGGEGNKYVCLPPLRTREDQAALWEGLKGDEVQTYATDHAAWKIREKLAAENFARIPAGVSNVQTSLGMLFSEGVSGGRISENQFVRLTSENPAKLFGMWPTKGTIAVGSDADVVVIDPTRAYRVSADDMYSHADYDPYEGYEARGWPVLTMSRGEVVAKDGVVTAEAGRGRLIRRARYSPVRVPA